MKKLFIILLIVAVLLSACASEYKIVCCKQWCNPATGVCTPKVCKTVNAPSCSGAEWWVDTVLEWPDNDKGL